MSLGTQDKINKEDHLKPFFQELVDIIKLEKPSKEKLANLKIKLCAKHKVKKIPTDIEILLNAPNSDFSKIKKLIQTKPTRTISGVAIVAVMTKPHKCPHGKCTICPGGIKSTFGTVPQSYTGHEPATMRGIRNKFEPYTQVFNRLEQYIVLGHVPDKVELIIMGGTFISTNQNYKLNYVTGCFQAMNDFSKLFFSKGKLNIKKFKEFFELPGRVGDEKRTKLIHAKINKLIEKTKQKKTKNKKQLNKTELKKELIHAQKNNEKTKIRCVGLTIETRPDQGRASHGNEMLDLGTTRVELGIQSVFDHVLQKINRGHDVNESIKSIQELKDLGFKLNFHYMLGLPGSNPKKDLEGLNELFKNQNFRPDMLKIYPCMVMPGTKLEKELENNEYKPISTKTAAEIIAKFKKFIPTYCRIMRVQRDIPPQLAVAGVDRSNLRQIVDQVCKKQNIRCRCIRCREIGRAKKVEKIELIDQKYKASNGTEFFISAEDKKNDVIAGFCRLRFPSKQAFHPKQIRSEITKDSALIRELHVYGEAESIKQNKEKNKKINKSTQINAKTATQHKGLGKKLLNHAEQIAKQNKKNKIIVISGIGAREYYRKLGYKKQGPYMVKNI